MFLKKLLIAREIKHLLGTDGQVSWGLTALSLSTFIDQSLTKGHYVRTCYVKGNLCPRYISLVSHVIIG